MISALWSIQTIYIYTYTHTHTHMVEESCNEKNLAFREILISEEI